MKSLIQWAIRNSPAMNTIMVGVLVVGIASLFVLRREEFPEFELEMIRVTVPYPGASPEAVEAGICQRIEEALRSIDYVKKMTTIATEGSGTVVLELEADVPDVQKLLNEVRSEIDRIPSFPVLAEDPDVQQVTLKRSAIQVGIVGPNTVDSQAQLQIRDITERVREELLLLPSVTTVQIPDAPAYQIDIEITEKTLRKYGLSLTTVADIVRRQNVETPSGNMKTESEEVLLRGKNKRLTGAEIAEIPIVTQSNGVVLTVGDLGVVRDEFADTTSISRINGLPGLSLSVDASSREDLLSITKEVREYTKTAKLPPGYSFKVWGDKSVNVRDRLDLLSRNGLQGLALVFLVLAVFLEIRLAFWVALGIPISVLGTCAFLLYSGETLNMLSMFAFLIALGIVVDDAIVIGENIYAHRQKGLSFVKAAIDGTFEVLPSVAASVGTTIIAFMPMMFVSGIMGKFFAVMPLAVISMLVISLVESTFILPCHLAHSKNDRRLFSYRYYAYTRQWDSKSLSLLGLLVGFPFTLLFDAVFYPVKMLESVSVVVNRYSHSFLKFVAERIYVPVLKYSLDRPAVALSVAVSMLLVSVGAIAGGLAPWVIFPKLDTNTITGRVIFPAGTPQHITNEATKKLEAGILQVNEELREKENEQDIVYLTHRKVGSSGSGGGAGNPNQSSGGSHAGNVFVQLIDTSQREVTSLAIVEAWRKAVGEIPGAELLQFGSNSGGPGGNAIEFKLLANSEQMTDLEEVVEKCKDRLAEYPGVYDISDDSRPGKWEYQLRIKDKAKAMGVTQAELADTVRAAYYGAEVMRLQRGRHEIKLMVRYPPDERDSLADFEEIRIKAADGIERPLTELADVNVARSFAEINRIDQKRSITVTADINEEVANARQIVSDLKANYLPEIFASYPTVSVRWEGQQAQSTESIQSLMVGFVIALLAMYVLLTLEFQSYIQPLLVLSIIPFGCIGAIWGHYFMGLYITLFSIMGLVALAGVVVNDSIVLMDFINARVQDGIPVRSALIDAGRRRFRPVLLSSVTTIAGLFPILTETSLQAQILVPMATTLCFGLLLATSLVLVLVPVFFFLYSQLIQLDKQSLESSKQPVLPVAPNSFDSNDSSEQIEPTVPS